MKGFLSFILLCTLGFPLYAASIEEAVEETRKDIQESTAELNQLRSEIQAERLPLTLRLQTLATEAAQLREEVQQIRNAKELRDQRRDQLTSDVEQLEAEKDFVESVFEEYRRAFWADLQPAETQYMPEDLPEEPGELWDRTTQWWDIRKGGYSFSGFALDEQGRELRGTFLIFGPLGYFVNEQIAGTLVTRPGSSLPGIYTIQEPNTRDAMLALSLGERAEMPVDVSGGDAMKVLQAKPGWVEHILQGGVVIYPLLLLGGISLLLSLHKAWDLHSLYVTLDSSDRDKLRLLKENNAEQVLPELSKVPMPLGSLMVAAYQHRNASRENLEEILHEHVLAVVPRLERSLGILAVFGGVAPLLGLLGTVTGMIHTFQLVTLFGSGNAQTLSGGISEALVTTELGLIIAIPILLIHALLTRKAKILLGQLEQSGVSIVNLQHSDFSESK